MTHRFYIFFAGVFMVLALLPFQASAQDGGVKPLPDFLSPTAPDIPPPAAETLPTPAQPTAPSKKVDPHSLENIPDEFLKEAMDFSDTCSASPKMSLYFNCRCMGARYLDRRIALGKDAHSSSVQLGLGPECADGTGIAGKLFEKCKRSPMQVPKGKDVLEFCSCYGNTYAKLYEKLGRTLRSREHVSLMTQARVECEDPAAARRLFGNRRP